MVCLSRPYPFKFFKGSLPQNLLRPLLNALSHLCIKVHFHIFFVLFDKHKIKKIIELTKTL